MNMKKILLLITFLLLTINLLAPNEKVLYIEERNAINYYDPLIVAITWVESKHGLYIWNPEEEAVGQFQIRPIRVNDYNRRTNSNYKLEDFYDYELSKKMFLYFAAGKTYEQAAKDWNGSGKMTIEYWKKVKNEL